MILLAPAEMLGAQWPWSRPPDRITATCTVSPAQVEQRSSARLKARVEADDSRNHPLGYVWSGNGGQIVGNGAEVEIDASSLNPGVYAVAAAVQDGYANRADCTAQFQVVIPENPLTANCHIEPEEAAAGSAVRVKMEASDRLGQSLRYRWITNWGAALPESAEAEIDTADLIPGEYSVTGRVDDEWGHATDCTATLRIVQPPPPPLPREVVNLAQIVFPFNTSQVGEPERQLLQKIIERMEHDANGWIQLEAYAGPDEMNPERLAAARAGAVRQLLLQEGVGEDRMKTVMGLGGRLGGVRNRTVDVIWIPDGIEY
jgi:outer membrane protein OmpA-like peptidoglycan-associated protein